MTGRTGFLFPSTVRPGQPISDPTWRTAMMEIRIGKFTPHSFRLTASTTLRELGYEPVWIDRQLGRISRKHAQMGRAAQYLKQRRRMMQEWSDYIDDQCGKRLV
jgi:integrase